MNTYPCSHEAIIHNDIDQSTQLIIIDHRRVLFPLVRKRILVPLRFVANERINGLHVNAETRGDFVLDILHLSQKVERSGKRRLRIDVLGAWEEGRIFPKQPFVHLDVRREERGDKFDRVLHTGLKVM